MGGGGGYEFTDSVGDEIRRHDGGAVERDAGVAIAWGRSVGEGRGCGG
jgi:hypothetical protein